MKQTFIIAAASIREHSRRKLLGFFGIASILITAVLILLVKDRSVEILIGAPRDVATTASLGALHQFLVVAALAVSMGNIGRPFATGEAMAILARPIERWQYALGRLLGSIGVVAALSLLMAVETQVVQLVATGGVSAKLWGLWAIQAFNASLMAAIATLLSVFISTAIITAVVTYVTNQLLVAILFLRWFVRTEVIKGFFAQAINVIWYITPKVLSSPLEVVQNPTDILPPNNLGFVAWAAAYLIGIVALSLFLTDRKEVI